MWYVIQTITGKEQELVDSIRQVMTGERKNYERCFVLYQEYARRSGGKLEFCVEVLFPSYVFVETDTPEEFFLSLKQVPKMCRLLENDGWFLNIYKEEEEFLRHMMEESKPSKYLGKFQKKQENEYIIRPSLVWVDEEGRIEKAEGILRGYVDKIIKQRLRKRSVIIEMPFCGKTRRIRLGIRLEGDESGEDIGNEG